MTILKSILLMFLCSIFFVKCSTSNESNEIPTEPIISNTIVVDLDGNEYQTVKICDQIWIKSNLNVSHYGNGDLIPQVSDPKEWANLRTGAWCYYNNDEKNGKIYGKLYNWYAVNDKRGLAPEGWHVSSDIEWTTMYNCLQGSVNGKLKEIGTLHWESPNSDANNISGFTGLAGGIRFYDNGAVSYKVMGLYGYWWTSSEYNESYAIPRFLGQYLAVNYSRNEGEKRNGFSVRCIKN